MLDFNYLMKELTTDVHIYMYVCIHALSSHLSVNEQFPLSIN